MKTMIGPYPLHAGCNINARTLLLLTLGMVVFVVVPFAKAAPGSFFVEEQPSMSDTAGQGQGNYVDEEEEKAYRAAKKETDPQKRAALLYAFYQKHPNSLLMESEDFQIIRPLEEEYSAYYAASQESDLEKRATMTIELHQKYPGSSFKPNVENDYAIMLRKTAEDKKFDMLESLAAKWLKARPNDKGTYAFLAEAAMNLQKFDKGAEYLEAIYAIQPSPDLAREIFSTYQKTQNSAKQIEWTEKLFKMPEFEKDYLLRFDSVTRFLSGKDFSKAAEYAQLTLKSADLIQQPDAKTQEQLKKVRRACYHIIGSNLMEKGSFAEAIGAFKKALEVEKYGEGYYKIGQCYENLKDIEKAILFYARAELAGGDFADKAKARLELLYKALHNDTLIGIEKVYKKTQEPDEN
jgi:tetratricopeptide (TPR) repeat protein